MAQPTCYNIWHKRGPVSWKTFNGVTQEMPYHTANESSILSLDSRQEETISPKVLNIAPLYSFEKTLSTWLYKSILQVILC